MIPESSPTPGGMTTGSSAAQYSPVLIGQQYFRLSEGVISAKPMSAAERYVLTSTCGTDRTKTSFSENPKRVAAWYTVSVACSVRMISLNDFHCALNFLNSSNDSSSEK